MCLFYCHRSFLRQLKRPAIFKFILSSGRSLDQTSRFGGMTLFDLLKFKSRQNYLT